MRSFITRLTLAALAASAIAPLSAAAITDSTPPTVSTVVPVTTYKNQATTYQVSTSDDIAGVAGCDLYVNSVNQGAMTMTFVSGMNWNATRSYTYTGSAGTISVYARCRDQAATPNFANGSTVSVTIFTDNSPPVVSNVLPATATAGVATTVSATVEESGAGINTCGVIINGVESGLMTASGSTYSLSGVTFASAGSYTVEVNCFDRATNFGTASRTVTVSAPADTTPPVVSNLQPTSATKDVAVTISVTATDNVAINKCTSTIDGVLSDASMSASGSTYSESRTFTTVGSHSISVNCRDTASPVNSTTVNGTVVVSATDGTLPTVSNLQPGTATAGVAAAITFTYGDNVGVTVCHLQVNGLQDDVNPTLSGGSGSTSGTASRTRTFTAGTYTILVFCEDAAGNESTNLTRSLVVSTGGAATSTPDTTLPSVGQIVQTAATAGTAITLTATASDNVGISACTLYVGGASQGIMSVSGGSASRSHTFSAAGSYNAEVRCTDAAGNVGIGTARVIAVAAASGSATSTPPTPVPLTTGSDPDADGDDLADADEAVYGTSPSNRDSDGDGFSDGTEIRNGFNPLGTGRLSAPTTAPAAGRLIKLACPAGADGFHACRAVYYYGRDGKRHPFPNARIYFTWFSDFSQVQVVDAASMGSLLLGKNVLPRPGVRLVKFPTVNTVYAVDRGGILRALANATVASGIYGSGWNAKIDDVDDTLFGNFQFGTDLTTASAFSPATATAGTTSIDGNF